MDFNCGKICTGIDCPQYYHCLKMHQDLPPGTKPEDYTPDD